MIIRGEANPAPLHPILFFIILMLLSVSWSIASGQEQEPFETIEAGVYYTGQTSSTEFAEFWEPEFGMTGLLMTPFYAGKIYLGGRYTAFHPRDGSLPEFTDIYLHLGWGYAFSPGGKLRWFTSVNVGNDAFIFEMGNLYSKYESELGGGVVSEVSVPIISGMRGSLRAGYHRIFTARRINMVLLSLGVSYTGDTPGWLEGFLP
ncbi:MAG TPA: hypothetical protein VKA68_03715 [bacterium]|nr:hypothetical protein [bacterium]